MLFVKRNLTVLSSPHVFHDSGGGFNRPNLPGLRVRAPPHFSAWSQGHTAHMLCPHKSSLHSCFFCKHSSLSSFSSQGPLPQALSFIRSPQTNHHLSCPLGADCATLSLSAASASQQCGTTEPQQASAKGRHTQAHTHTWVCMHTVFFPLRKMSDKGKPTSARRAPAACLTSPRVMGTPAAHVA